MTECILNALAFLFIIFHFTKLNTKLKSDFSFFKHYGICYKRSFFVSVYPFDCSYITTKPVKISLLILLFAVKFYNKVNSLFFNFMHNTMVIPFITLKVIFFHLPFALKKLLFIFCLFYAFNISTISKQSLCIFVLFACFFLLCFVCPI